MAGSVAATKYDSGGRSRVGDQGAITGADVGNNILILVGQTENALSPLVLARVTLLFR